MDTNREERNAEGRDRRNGYMEVERKPDARKHDGGDGRKDAQKDERNMGGRNN